MCLYLEIQLHKTFLWACGIRFHKKQSYFPLTLINVTADQSRLTRGKDTQVHTGLLRQYHEGTVLTRHARKVQVMHRPSPSRMLLQEKQDWGLKAEKTVLKWNPGFTELLCNYCHKILLHHQTMPGPFFKYFCLGPVSNKYFCSKPSSSPLRSLHVRTNTKHVLVSGAS